MNNIVDIGHYYVYRHIRHDKNEVFYIGKGTKIKGKDSYIRSKTKERNNIWKSIANKTDYDIEIMLESDNEEFILTKEKEFINLYGRINNKSGTLANILKEDYTINHKALKIAKAKRLNTTKLLLGTDWTPIPNYENYLINKNGQVINGNNNKLIAVTYNKYKQIPIPQVWLYGKVRTSKPLRLILAQVFIPNPNKYPEVINIDGNPNNIKLDNLRWVTREERIQHLRKFGLDISPKGLQHYNCKVTPNDKKEIKYIASHLKISQRELGSFYGICSSHAWSIINNKK